KDLARKIRGNERNIRFLKHHHQHAEVMRMCADSGKAEKLLRWKPKIGLDEGIKKTTEWLRQQ
ncbi:MAG: NAD-dependent dehydratase, partial [Candidatus Omnitrophica bacterium]|nr:NAD-dependent dehydratase [Candidatus Omnitrophota bacterium]